MKFTRTRYLVLGVLLALLGLQFRLVDTFVLNEKASQMVTKIQRQMNDSEVETQTARIFDMKWLHSNSLVPNKSIQPPPWLGWVLMSMGGVIILHAIAMRPGE